MINCVFFDRDGTLGSLSDVRYPQTFTYFSDAFETIDLLKRRGKKIIIVTNQACIARGTDGGYDFAAEFAALGADDFFLCPHDGKDGCSCRKPATGLLEQAFRKYALVKEECIMVGDRPSDILCGKRMGVYTALLAQNGVSDGGEPQPDFVVRRLSELPDIIDKIP